MSDTRACSAVGCHGCEAAAAGLCARRYRLGEGSCAHVMQAGESDYRVWAAAFLKRLHEDGAHDSRFHELIASDERRQRRSLAAIEKQRVEAPNGSLAYASRHSAPLPSTKIHEILGLFPSIDRNPSRFEIQLFLYMYRYHRCGIDADHVAGRFLVPRASIDRMLRGYFGATYASLLSTIRNEHSKRYLSIARLRVNEAGELAGYRNLGSFSVSFKRHEGRSPKEYRAAPERRAEAEG